MASKAQASVDDDQVLKYKTWVLKVSIHCEGCKRKVNKLLHKINGVYTISIESQQQRVTVTGNVGVETIIQRLLNTGKHAEIWPETLAGEHKKAPTNGKQDQSSQNETRPQPNTTDKDKTQRGVGRGGTTEKNKKKGQNGNINTSSGYCGGPAGTGLWPRFNHTPSYYVSNDYWASSFVYANTSYTASHPIQISQSWPYTCAVSGRQEIYDSLEIFSDENANGCSIM